MNLQNFLEIVPVIFAAGESKLFHLSGAYFEIIDAPNPVDVVLTDRNGVPRGVMKNAEASFFIKSTDYDTIQLTSATAQTIRFAFGTSEAGTRRSTGSVTISGSVVLDAATLAALESTDLNPASLLALSRPQPYTHAYKSNALLSANSPETVFLPGSNVNGAIVWNANWMGVGSGGGVNAYVAKSSAPASVVDGDVIHTGFVGGSGIPQPVAPLQNPVFIGAGKGLYAINNYGDASSTLRHVLYTLL